MSYPNLSIIVKIKIVSSYISSNIKKLEKKVINSRRRYLYPPTQFKNEKLEKMLKKTLYKKKLDLLAIHTKIETNNRR